MRRAAPIRSRSISTRSSSAVCPLPLAATAVVPVRQQARDRRGGGGDHGYADQTAHEPQSTASAQPQAAHSPRPASAASRSSADSSAAWAVFGGIDSVRAYPADTSGAFTNRSGRPGRSR